MKKGDRIEGEVIKYDFPNVGTVEVIGEETTEYVKVKNAILSDPLCVSKEGGPLARVVGGRKSPACGGFRGNN